MGREELRNELIQLRKEYLLQKRDLTPEEIDEYENKIKEVRINMARELRERKEKNENYQRRR
ncbi:MAG: hypothetical protein GX265_01910 [Mollicutes bacterium]|jgi:hypothetical protein|nr:hypothetical protein [Mollicutes bacterium]